LSLSDILNELIAELDRIDQAINALEASSGGRTRRPGRPRGIPGRRGRGGRLSAAARKRISEGMKRRWALRKKNQKSE